MEVVKKKINDLKPAPYNPRKDLQPYDEEYKRIKNSIDRFGYVDPIIYNKRTGLVVGGHQRLKVLKDLGYSDVDVVEVDLAEDEEKALNIALNKISGEWDFPKLNDLLKELKNKKYDLNLLGYDKEELEKLRVRFELRKKHTEIVEDNVDNIKANYDIKRGEVWALGDHRLMCGDSTKREDVECLMNEEKADCVFTDPPYGMKKGTIKNDNLNKDDMIEFNKLWVPLSFEFLKDKGSWYCWGTDESVMDIYAFILKDKIKNNEITFKNLLIWAKTNDLTCLFCNDENLRKYHISSEKCLFLIKGNERINQDSESYIEDFEPLRIRQEEELKKAGLTREKLKDIVGVDMWSHWVSRSQWHLMTDKHLLKISDYCKRNDIDAFNSSFLSEFEDMKKKQEDIKTNYYSTLSYFDASHDKMSDVWTFPITNVKERQEAGGHQTPKPLVICGRAIKTSSKEGDLVLDLFGGSGSTLIACEQLGRKCYMMELNEYFCGVICARFEKNTGIKPYRIN